MRTDQPFFLVRVASEVAATVRLFFEVRGQQKMLAKRTNELDLRDAAVAELERQHAEPFAADERFRSEPHHGISLSADEVWAYWRADDLIEIPFLIVVQNAWIYPVTLTTLGGTVAFTSGYAGQKLAAEVRRYTVPGLQACGIVMSYRWQPSVDRPAQPLAANGLNFVTASLTLHAYFQGQQGEFSLTDVPVQARVLIDGRRSGSPSI